MRISHSLLPKIRLLVLVIFIAVCTWIFGYLWTNSGGNLPLVSKAGYQVSVQFPRIANLVPDSEVKIAGVHVGKVDDLVVKGDKVRVTMELEPVQRVLHEGATVQVRSKTLVEESYLEITDGSGSEIADGATLPEGAGKPPTQLNDVLASLNPGTRKALAGTIRSLGDATKGSKDSISAALSGLGHLGREGGDAVGALAAQSKDLRQLSGNAATLLAALDTRQGDIATLVANADRLTDATAGTRGEIERVMRELPGLLDTANGASGSVTELSKALGPVAKNLKAAGPDLDKALRELPATAADLRATLPYLDGALGKANDTLERVPTVAAEASRLLPTLDKALRDINPILGYLKPYGPEVASWFTNMSQSMSRGDVNGKALRAFAIFNEQSLKNLPVETDKGPLRKSNAYPKPGQATDPAPFEGEYPRVKKAPR